jgi:hypothetical protein
MCRAEIKIFFYEFQINAHKIEIHSIYAYFFFYVLQKKKVFEGTGQIRVCFS